MPEPLRLLIDCGNTALKVAIARGPALLVHERLAVEPAALDRFVAIGIELGELVVLPGNQRHAAVVRDWWNGRGPQRTIGAEIPLPELGQYPGCGADRVLAGLAAGQEPVSCIIVDAGTAVTLGAWKLDAEQRLRFLGGLILPGAHACAAGLALAAPALPAVEPIELPLSAVQRTTDRAIANAIGFGHPAMVAACVQRLRQECAIERVLVTGGGGPLLVQRQIVSASGLRPSLVLQGLALAVAGTSTT